MERSRNRFGEFRQQRAEAETQTTPNTLSPPDQAGEDLVRGGNRLEDDLLPQDRADAQPPSKDAGAKRLRKAQPTQEEFRKNGTSEADQPTADQRQLELRGKSDPRRIV